MEMFNLHHGVIQIPVARMVKLSLLPTFKVLLLDSKSRLCKQRAGKNLHPLFLLNITDSFADTYSFFFGMYLLTPPPHTISICGQPIVYEPALEKPHIGLFAPSADDIATGRKRMGGSSTKTTTCKAPRKTAAKVSAWVAAKLLAEAISGLDAPPITSGMKFCWSWFYHSCLADTLQATKRPP